MPKDTKSCSKSTHYQPYPSQSDLGVKLDEIQCPICFETPHNPVLLMCPSHDKGCYPYMCDTMPALSNCFDQFKKTSLSPRRILCPLCRGEVNGYVEAGWSIGFMNAKPRDCSQEKCEFNGSYEELSTHVAEYHPQEEPRVVEPRVMAPRVEIPNVTTFVTRGGRRLTTGREYKRRIRAFLASEGEVDYF